MEYETNRVAPRGSAHRQVRSEAHQREIKREASMVVIFPLNLSQKVIFYYAKFGI